MEEDLRARLLAVPAIVALTGKISWFERPRGAENAIELTMVYAARGWTHSGPDGFDTARVQIDCWSVTAATAQQLAKLVLAALEAGPVVAGTTRFQPAMLSNKLHSVEDAAGVPIYRVMLDLEFNHQPAT